MLDHQAGDLIAEAQAGTPLHSLQEQCGREGQRLVVDEMVPATTVGGMLATDTSGPQRMLVGTARDLLHRRHVVRADGVVAKAGGRVVKNVAGYDLGKLLIGSFGTLGVITEAIFRLHPVPESSRWVSAPVADLGAADRRRSGPSRTPRWCRTRLELDVDADGAGSVSVLVAGRETGVEQRAAAVSLDGGRGRSPRSSRATSRRWAGRATRGTRARSRSYSSPACRPAFPLCSRRPRTCGRGSRERRHRRPARRASRRLARGGRSP